MAAPWPVTPRRRGGPTALPPGADAVGRRLARPGSLRGLPPLALPALSDELRLSSRDDGRLLLFSWRLLAGPRPGNGGLPGVLTHAGHERGRRAHPVRARSLHLDSSSSAK